MLSGPIHLHIADVLTAVPAQAGVEAGMVMLTEDNAPFRSLRIIIGQAEAHAILAGWHGAVPGRPSTWDLFVSTVALLEGRIDRVVITAVQEERHYFAHIELEQSGERRILACRPSDAIALAVRAYNVDILAEPAVLEAAGVLPDGSKPGKLAEEAPAEADETLAEREAALAAREAALAARERAVMAIEAGQGGAGDGADAPASEVEEPVVPAGPVPEVGVAPPPVEPDAPAPEPTPAAAVSEQAAAVSEPAPAAPAPAAAMSEPAAPAPASGGPHAASVANSDPAAPAP